MYTLFLCHTLENTLKMAKHLKCFRISKLRMLFVERHVFINNTIVFILLNFPRISFVLKEIFYITIHASLSISPWEIFLQGKNADWLTTLIFHTTLFTKCFHPSCNKYLSRIIIYNKNILQHS